MSEHLYSAAGAAVAHLVYLCYCHADSFQHLLSFWVDTNLFSSNYLRLFYISGNIFDSFTLQNPMQIARRIGAKGIITQQDLTTVIAFETEDQLIYLTENIYIE